jgi:hypothetical protein
LPANVLPTRIVDIQKSIDRQQRDETSHGVGDSGEFVPTPVEEKEVICGILIEF